MISKFLSLFIPNQKHYLIYKKGENHQLETNLFQYEFDCKCNYSDCNRTIIDSSIPISFQRTRDQFNSPIFISSGHRCQRHNSDQSNSVDDSDHIWGMAIDLVPVNGEVSELGKIAKIHFKKVLIYNSYLHCSN